MRTAVTRSLSSAVSPSYSSMPLEIHQIAASRSISSAASMSRYPTPNWGKLKSCMASSGHADEQQETPALGFDERLHRHVGGNLVSRGNPRQSKDAKGGQYDRDAELDRASIVCFHDV